MPTPSVDTVWQEIRMLKARVCELEKDVEVVPSSSTPQILQFVVGDSSSPVYTKNLSDVEIPVQGGYILTINDNVVMDSISVFLDGQSLPPMGRTDRESFTVGYDVNSIQIVKPNLFPFVNKQLYEVRYEST